MHYHSPLRYPGGKSILTNFMKQVIQQNDLYDCTYVEPYAGGAAIALNLLFSEYARKIIINDLDYGIYSFWYSVLNHADEMSEMITETPVTMQTWNQQKEIHQNVQDYSMLEVGFSTFFLNRTNHSGIIEGGVIGGKKQSGKWKMDVRYNTDDLILRIKRISTYRNRIEICNMDACQLINERRNKLSSNALFYIDPPYYVKGKELYRHHYRHNDHIYIRDTVGHIDSQKWILTYDDVPQISELYKNYRQVRYYLSYTAQRKRLGTEVMIFDDDISIPKVKNPARVS